MVQCPAGKLAGFFMRIFLLLKNCVLMLCVTLVGILGLFGYLQQRNWPMVALFCVAVPGAAVITFFQFWALIQNWSSD